MPVTAANDPQHAQVRLTVTAGADTEHVGTITRGSRRARRRRERRVPYNV
jgi:hypothetical protein